jgi:arginyl-tRNA synthetase
MDLFARLHEAVCDALESLWPGVSCAAVVVEPPHDACHGDAATNAPLVLAKSLKMSPRDLAETLARRMKSHPWVQDAVPAGAGFVNMTLKPLVWPMVLETLFRARERWGHVAPGSDAPLVNVEYVSANPTGPLHVGHARGAVLGDALARILEVSGFRVVREYYINDAGHQADQLGRSVWRRYMEALGRDMGPWPESAAYPGEYLVPVGQDLARQWGDRYADSDEAHWLPPMRQAGISAMMDLIRRDLEALGIHHEVWSSEKALEDAGRVDEAVARLAQEGYVYEGVLEAPRGQAMEDWEPRPQMLFRSTAFGDDCDRPLRRSDGQWTYFARDIAYHYDKWLRGGLHQINVWGADHAGYVKRIQGALHVMTGGGARLDTSLCHVVSFVQDGQPVKMSKRAGTFFTVRDLTDQVGPDVVRFVMVTRKEGAPLECDLARLVEGTKDNPVFYIQYARARIHSVEQQALRMGLDLSALDQGTLKGLSLHRLDQPAEQAMMHALACWPRVLTMAARAREPHRIAFALQQLATRFHALWQQGKDNAVLRFVVPDQPDVTLARLALNRMIAWVLDNGMNVLGVTLKKEM